MRVIDRARAYVSRMDAAVSGSGGHDRTFRVACVLVDGFGLGELDALELMREYNSRCEPAWSEHELLHKIKSAPRTNPGHLLIGTEARNDAKNSRRKAGVAGDRSAEVPRDKRPQFDMSKLRDYVLGMPSITVDHFREWSSVEIPQAKEQNFANASRLFLETVYRKGQRVLIFTNEMSQGQYLYEVGRGLFKLAKERGEKATPCADMPNGGPVGVYFLACPVTGLWSKGHSKFSRRSGATVTDWRWLVLESDEAEGADWLKFLAKAVLPIAAIYSSGGKSYHALIDTGATSKEQWDAARDALFYQILCPVGGDGAAMTAVRLTRLPGMYRRGKRSGKGFEVAFFDKPRLQELIYLDPKPTWESIREKGALRRG